MGNRLRSCALTATITVLADIRTAPAAGVSSTPQVANTPASLELCHLGCLVLRQHPREHRVDAEFFGDRLRNRTGVAGEHRDLEAQLVQCPRGSMVSIVPKVLVAVLTDSRLELDLFREAVEHRHGEHGQQDERHAANAGNGHGNHDVGAPAG